MKKVENKKKFLSKTKIIILSIISVIIVLSLVLSVYFIFQKRYELNKTLDIKKEIIITLEDNLPDISAYLSKKDYEDNKDNLKISYLDKELINNDLKIGEYEVEIIDKSNNKKYKSKLIIKDNQAPVLKLQEFTIEEGNKYDISNFIYSCTDDSKKDCKLNFSKEEMSNYEKSGEYEIVIKASDESNNIVEEKTKLIIKQKSVTTTTKKVQTTKKTNTNSNTNSQSNSNSNSNNNASPSSGSSSNLTIDTSVPHTTSELLPDARTNYSANISKINEVLSYVNQYRSEVNVSPLILDEQLSIAATVRAIEMGIYNKFSHTRPNGSSCFTVVSDIGLHYGTLGENIAYGNGSYGTPAGVSNGWRNSEGHYQNMINSSFTKIGIGAFKYNGVWYWTQIFAG